MLLLPYSSVLGLNRIPLLTYSVILVCLLVFVLQTQNREDVNHAVNDYCHLINDSSDNVNDYDKMRYDSRYCFKMLHVMHNQYELDNWQQIYLDNVKVEVSDNQLQQIINFDLHHYDAFILAGAPRNLDINLMFYPLTFNPVKMLSSNFAHADWWHIIFNLIFFFAFTPALEIIIASNLKFIGVFLGITVVCGLSYSFVSLASQSVIPTLGLSGIVTGMIGFSAYMMPHARVRTLFWFLIYIRRLFIPVWILAIWFIGLDIYDLFFRGNNAGVNLVAHVAGGISGYLIALIWFKSRRNEIQEELDDQIEHSRARYEDAGSGLSSSMGDQRRIRSEYQQDNARKEWQTYKDKLYKFVKTGNSSEAMLILLQDYEFNAKSPETYEELFSDIGEWRKKRSYYCAGRLLINLYLQTGKVAKAMQIIKQCINDDKQFLLPDSSQVINLTHQAMNFKQYVLAYYIINNYKLKYKSNNSCLEHVLLEANLLNQHLDKKQDAITLLEKEIVSSTIYDAQKLNSLLDAIKHS